ncbi:MAG: 3-deoxy-7-phosphoheptulonate synthase [Candidatus Riflebacteria bacterium]|nr:3-deoxy-7-phosphoheptulonate synthase [Candidatus Riflebacteria bacterium]
MAKEAEKWQDVEEVIDGHFPYYLASRKCHKSNSIIRIGKGNNQIIFGDKEIPLIAGPCAIETPESAFAIAEKVKEAGVKIFRGMLFKPRSSPYSFQGIGKDGLEILDEIKKKFGLLLVTEVRETSEADLVANHVDIFQIGTRNMSNFQLLKYVGQMDKPIILKRGMGSNIVELLCAAEYILSYGNPNVILCERGIRTFEQYTRFGLDIAAIPSVKELSHLPIIIDPSHSSGKSSLVSALTMAGIAAGADGVIMEVHDDPEKAFSDGTESITPTQLKDLIKLGQKVASAVGRII